jgi:hypothetical protein
MRQVLLHLPFRNTEPPGQLIGGQQRIGQKIDDPLSRGPFGRQHDDMVRADQWKSQMAGTACSPGMQGTRL